MFRNLIFDWSGTLVDDLGPVLDATNAVLAVYGREPMDREEFRRRFRLPYVDFYAEHLPDVSMAELEDHFRRAFDASTAPVLVLPHAREKLEWCATHGIRCFVLSSMDERAFARQLEEFDMAALFEATYAGVIDKRAKIHEMLAAHGLDPAETAFVGDMVHDVETARHGGVASVAVLSGYTHADALAAVRPDITVPDLSALRIWLERGRSTRRPLATVGALIVDGDGKVLMLRTHKWSGLWGIPGGKIDRGEPSEDALRREVREETGLELEEIRFAMVQDCIDSPEYLRPAHFILLNYVARARRGDVTLNDEAEEFRWLSPAAALELPLNEPTRRLLERVLERRLLDSL